MEVEVRPVITRKDLDVFIRLPWRLYRNDPNWVPPLLSEMWATLTGPDSWMRRVGPHQAFVAWADGVAGPGRQGLRPAGRIVVGYDEQLARIKGFRHSYVTLFESVNDYAVARALFDTAAEWTRQRGLSSLRGPISPSNGDDYRGLLVDAFDLPPVMMGSYNPAFYPEFFERYGFAKEMDLYAYHYDIKNIPDRFERLADYAMRKFHFRVDPFDLRRLEGEVRDVKDVLDRAMPQEWYDMAPPSLDEVRAMAHKLKAIAVPDFILIARATEGPLAGRPIGFLIGLPDYNQVLRHLNGRLFPFGFAKFLWYRRRINAGRIFVLFVTPEYRKKGVTGAMFMKCLLAAKRRGYLWGEGSTIGELNEPMRRDAEGAGGRHYKTYRIYGKTLN
jgi:GNAT superfamily N-acetyltransferase